MNWEKKGLIYFPNAQFDWNKTHAQVPVVDKVNEHIWRIYYATRNLKNQSQTSYIEVEAGNPKHILYEHKQPILKLGKLGAFDESGIMPSWVVTCQNKKYLYYIGWSVRHTVPYHNAIGLAISDDGGKTFKKFAEGPIFDVTYNEPYFTGTSCVLLDNGLWKNWYLSCIKWEIINEKPEAFYHIKYAESHDGIHWRREGVVAIDFKNNDEAGIVSASVVKETNASYKMWFSFRKGQGYRADKQSSYRIGYAKSQNGIIWERLDDEAGITLSTEGWDSEMMAYPHVIKYKDETYMFYNGNGFGRTGFGYATLKYNEAST